MFDNLNQGDTNTDSDTSFKTPDNSSSEDKEHSCEISIRADVVEEFDIFRSLFEEGDSNNGDHRAEDGSGEIVEVWEEGGGADDCADA